MNRKIFGIFGMVVLLSVSMTTNVWAHPPQDMELAYDLDESELTVTIAHLTPAPGVHYIERIEIRLNGELVLAEDYDSQPSNEVFVYNYTVEAEIGDEIEVTAVCNIQGAIVRSLIVEDPAQDNPPVVEIKNPTKGYFHFSGIRLFATYLDVVYDTMGFGGFRVRPVQVLADDDNDTAEDLIVNVYIDDELRGEATYNSDNGFHEIQWTGPRLGVFTLKATAEDTKGNIGEAEMDVWYFCFVPE